jgi:aryl-alcohol dehydrogenase-like predicted oxidoreductase/enamine deaminase RidA (YjgF/YER057c/UK114 family)
MEAAMGTIPTTTLGDNLEITRIVTGLWQVSGGHGQIDPERAVDHMARLHEGGLTSFDMADHYGPAEELTGRLIERIGAESAVQASTKWCPEPADMTADVVRAAIERSRSRLASRSIDLLQFHWWDYLDPRYLDAMLELAKLREEGLIANLGLTNFNTAHLRILLSLGVPIVSNQVHYSLLDSRAAGEMTSVCEPNGIKLLCYGTLAGGFFAEGWLDRPEPADDEIADNWSRMKYLRFIRTAGGWQVFQTLLRALDRVARKHGVSVANVAVRWVLQQPIVAAVLVGTRLGLSDHTEDNARTFSFELDREDLALIDDARAGLTPIPGDCGDEYRRPPYLTAAGDLSDHKTRRWRPVLCERHPDAPVERVAYGSGTPWESIASFSRAVRRGDAISVSGTTATYGDRLVGAGDPAAQADFCLDKIEAAIETLGGRMSDVVRTRIYVPELARDWEPVARVHGRRLAGIEPANTLVGAPLVGDGYLVEMEADAVIVGE